MDDGSGVPERAGTQGPKQPEIGPSRPRRHVQPEVNNVEKRPIVVLHLLQLLHAESVQWPLVRPRGSFPAIHQGTEQAECKWRDCGLPRNDRLDAQLPTTLRTDDMSDRLVLMRRFPWLLMGAAFSFDIQMLVPIG